MSRATIADGDNRQEGDLGRQFRERNRRLCVVKRRGGAGERTVRQHTAWPALADDRQGNSRALKQALFGFLRQG